jgi:large subunit ribosomal protein L6
VEIADGKVMVSPTGSSRRARQLWGLTRSLIHNMMVGVKEPFRKELGLTGIGYRAEKKGDDLLLSLGFSHPIEFKAPSGIKLEVVDKVKIIVSGADKQQVGQVAARLRSLKPPEPYKGKGFKYADEVIRKKPGKAGKAGASLGAEGK